MLIYAIVFLNLLFLPCLRFLLESFLYFWCFVRFQILFVWYSQIVVVISIHFIFLIYLVCPSFLSVSQVFPFLTFFCSLVIVLDLLWSNNDSSMHFMFCLQISLPFLPNVSSLWPVKLTQPAFNLIILSNCLF